MRGTRRSLGGQLLPVVRFASSARSQSKQNIDGIKAWIMNNLQGGSINDLSNAFVKARKQRVTFTNTDLLSIYKMMEERRDDIKDFHAANIINGLRLSHATQDSHIINFAKYMNDKLISTPLPPRAIGTLMHAFSAVRLRHPAISQLLSAVASQIHTTSRPFPSTALCEITSGLQHMNPRCSGVRSILKLLPSRIHNTLTPFTAQSIANTLYNLHNYSSYDHHVRTILAALEPQIRLSDVPFHAKDVACCLYGMRNMSDEHFEVQITLDALLDKVAAVKSMLSSSLLASAFAGLRSMKGHPPTMKMLQVLTKKLQLCDDVLAPHHIVMVLTGFRGIGSDDPIARHALETLIPKIRQCPVPFQRIEISGAYFALQNLSSEHAVVLELLAVLNEKLAKFSGSFDAQTTANSLFGLRNMSNNHSAVLDTLRSLAPKILECGEGLEVRHISAAFQGLRSMSTCQEVDHVLLALQHKLHVSIFSEFDAIAVGSMYGSFRNMNNRSKVVREVLASITEKIHNGLPKRVEGDNIAHAFLGLRNMHKLCPEVVAAYSLLNDLLHIADNVTMRDIRNILLSLTNSAMECDTVQCTFELAASKVANLSDSVSANDFSFAVLSLQHHCVTPAMNSLLRALILKSPLDDVTFTDMSRVLQGVQHMESSNEIVLSILNNMAEKIDIISVDNAPSSIWESLVRCLFKNVHSTPPAISLHGKLLACAMQQQPSSEEIIEALHHVELAAPHPRSKELLTLFASMLHTGMQLQPYAAVRIMYAHVITSEILTDEVFQQCVELSKQLSPLDAAYVLLMMRYASAQQSAVLFDAVSSQMENYTGTYPSRSIVFLIKGLAAMPYSPSVQKMFSIVANKVPSTMMDYHDAICSFHDVLVASKDKWQPEFLITALAEKVEITADKYNTAMHTNITTIVIEMCDELRGQDVMYHRIGAKLRNSLNLELPIDSKIVDVL